MTSASRLAVCLVVSLAAHAAAVWLALGAPAGMPTPRAPSPAPRRLNVVGATWSTSSRGEREEPMRGARAQRGPPSLLPSAQPAPAGEPSATPAAAPDAAGELAVPIQAATPAENAVGQAAPTSSGGPTISGAAATVGVASGAAGSTGAATGGEAAGSGTALSEACWTRVSQELTARARTDLPRAVLSRGLSGRVVLRFLLGADGVVRSSRVEESSGQALLDEAALGLLAAPFPLGCSGEGRWPLTFRAGSRR